MTPTQTYDIGKPYTVVAHHANHQSHNRMHQDGLPQKLGFRGPFVLGVANYGTMTRARVSHFGKAWLSRAVIETKFIKPVCEGDCLRIETLWGVIQPQMLFAGIFLLFTLGLYATRSRLIINAPVIFLGKISFSLYIIHFGVLHFFQSWQPLGLALPQPWALPAAYALVLTVSSLAAWATHRFIEQPGIQAGRLLTVYIERPAAQ